MVKYFFKKIVLTKVFVNHNFLTKLGIKHNLKKQPVLYTVIDYN